MQYCQMLADETESHMVEIILPFWLQTFKLLKEEE